MPDRPSRKEFFEATLSGAAQRPPLPPLRHDRTNAEQIIPHSLKDYRALESAQHREARLRALWRQLPSMQNHTIRPEDAKGEYPVFEHPDLTPERAEELRRIYVEELLRDMDSAGGSSSNRSVDWETFRSYADQKEAELWAIFHDELDLDGNGHLDCDELRHALDKAGIEISPSTVVNFMAFLTSSPHSRSVSFPEFRDFLLLLPRRASPSEMFQFYEVRRYMGDDGRGTARVNMEGDVSLSAEDRPPSAPASARVDLGPKHDGHPVADSTEGTVHSVKHQHAWFGGTTAAKFLFAGGIAGAVSRTATAPFDRLKVFLITQPPQLMGINGGGKGGFQGTRAIALAISSLYAEGGLRAFWVGNGLNVVKIFPESAIKFFSYESSKRFFAKYYDKVDDPRNISGTSRFISGGIGGITSQLSIYPIETLKTQMMSSTGEPQRTVLEASKRLWALGGTRAVYRGLVIGLVGVFPYSAIDMSTFEALKIAYVTSFGQPEPGVLATLAFGSISGSVGATSVYPLNLVRTRLQASGTSGHPQIYTGVLDVVQKTFEREGWKGFYRGLAPTLAKVVPAVSISYVVYEKCKKSLGVA